MKHLGKKIAVVGIMASGKSTFARKLAERMHLPLLHVDAIMWKPGWNYIGDAETATRLDQSTSDPEWILEGYIVKEARSFVFERADTIVYLDYSWLLVSVRYIMRWWKHRKNPRPELPGSPEKFELKFLERIRTKGETVSLDAFLDNESFKPKIIVFKSPKEAEKFLQNI